MGVREKQTLLISGTDRRSWVLGLTSKRMARNQLENPGCLGSGFWDLVFTWASRGLFLPGERCKFGWKWWSWLPGKRCNCATLQGSCARKGQKGLFQSHPLCYTPQWTRLLLCKKNGSPHIQGKIAQEILCVWWQFCMWHTSLWDYNSCHCLDNLIRCCLANNTDFLLTLKIWYRGVNTHKTWTDWFSDVLMLAESY